MSKRSRRSAPADGRHGNRASRRPSKPGRRAIAATARGGLRWAGIGAAAAAVLIVGLGAWFLVSSSSGLPGLQGGAPPWPPETAHLRARLDAIGIPALSTGGSALHLHQHLDVYVDGRHTEVPADIGIDLVGGYLSPLHTHDSTGIVHIESPVVRDFTLGDLFDVWGIRFDGHCIGGECDGNGRSLTVYVNGQPFTNDPRTLTLAAHQEIVVAIGTPAELPSPIPSMYPFPGGL